MVFSIAIWLFSSSDEFSKGLGFLWKDNRWKQLGEKGYNCVKEYFSLDKAIKTAPKCIPMHNQFIIIHERIDILTLLMQIVAPLYQVNVFQTSIHCIKER